VENSTVMKTDKRSFAEAMNIMPSADINTRK